MNFLNRKINPTYKKSSIKLDGSPNFNDRVEIGPTELAFDEWIKAGIEIPNLKKMREFRVNRLIKELNKRDLDGVLVFDPLNIRYITDTTNMQLWNSHNPFRACFISNEGYIILWDYKGLNLLSSFNPLVKEVRNSASMFYFANGDKTKSDAQKFALEIKDILNGKNKGTHRLAVDKIQIHGLRALESQGLEIHDGEEVMERTRSIKGEEEIKAMKCAIHSCEMGMYEMKKHCLPGKTENDIWAVLHSENIKRGGEWIETRLLASGQRTNPWFQECGPRIIQNNEILAFDTDLIGCYGICVDISRTWFIGDKVNITSKQKELYTEAYLQIKENTSIIKPGMNIKELVFGGRELPKKYEELRYSCKMHGVGLCDEWPLVQYPIDYVEGAFDAILEPGMILCVEAYIGEEGGFEGIKLEDQVLITDTGHKNLTNFPFEKDLMN
jgi:Xaa-Pro aminopeptidase